ncbi:MAG: hypothetical protein ACI9WU_005478 [Myxococcota bacterium]|jgi:hypothetical protein
MRWIPIALLLAACSNDTATGIADVASARPDTGIPTDPLALPIELEVGVVEAACRNATDPIFLVGQESEILRWTPHDGSVATVFEDAVEPFVTWVSTRTVAVGRSGVPNAFAMLDPTTGTVTPGPVFEDVTGRPLAFGHQACALMGDILECRLETDLAQIAAKVAPASQPSASGGRLLLVGGAGTLEIRSSTAELPTTTSVVPLSRVIHLSGADVYVAVAQTLTGADLVSIAPADGQATVLVADVGTSDPAPIGTQHVWFEQAGLHLVDVETAEVTPVAIAGALVEVADAGLVWHAGEGRIEWLAASDRSSRHAAQLPTPPVAAGVSWDASRLWVLDEAGTLTEWSLTDLFPFEPLRQVAGVAGLLPCARCHLAFVGMSPSVGMSPRKIGGAGFGVSRLCAGD